MLMLHVFEVTVLLIYICFAFDDITRYASKCKQGVLPVIYLEGMSHIFCSNTSINKNNYTYIIQ